MSADTIMSTFTISGGVEVSLLDQTSHYFGGYYHVRIQVVAHVPLLNEYFDATVEFEDAIKRLGTSVRFSRILEKMAVPENMIETVRSELMASFNANVRPYLMRDNFCDNFVRSEYRKALKPAVPRFR